MRKLIYLFGVMIVIVFGWHLIQARYLASELQTDELPSMTVHINPVTNVVRFHFDIEGEEDPGKQFALTMLSRALQSSPGRSELESEIALMSRERLNIYAMLIAYRVRVTSAE